MGNITGDISVYYTFYFFTKLLELPFTLMVLHSISVASRMTLEYKPIVQKSNVPQGEIHTQVYM